MKKLSVFLVILLIIALYCWQAYAHIYRKIGNAKLSSPDAFLSYNIFSNTQPNSANLVYAAIGDSLTAGVGVNQYEKSYPYLLAQRLAVNNNYILKDVAYPGARTENVVKDLLPKAIEINPDVITILIGVNDIHGKIDIETFKKNYKFILTELKSKTKAKIYAISIPYLGGSSLILPPYNYYFRYQTDQYNHVIKILAEEQEIKYVDIASAMSLVDKKPDYYAADSFHPSALTYERYAGLIYDSISK